MHVGGQFVVQFANEGGREREGREGKKEQTSSSSTVSLACNFFRCSSATWTSSSTLWLSRRDSAWAMSVVGRSDWTAFTARTRTRDFGNVVFRAIVSTIPRRLETKWPGYDYKYVKGEDRRNGPHDLDAPPLVLEGHFKLGSSTVLTAFYSPLTRHSSTPSPRHLTWTEKTQTLCYCPKFTSTFPRQARPRRHPQTHWTGTT